MMNSTMRLPLDSEEAAFLLGVLAGGRTEELSPRDQAYLRDCLGTEPFLVTMEGQASWGSLRLSGAEGALPALAEHQRLPFVRGLLSSAVSWKLLPSGEPQLSWSRAAREAAALLTVLLGEEVNANEGSDSVTGVLAFDVLGRCVHGTMALPSLVELLHASGQRISGVGPAGPAGEIRVQLVHPDAHAPKKEHVSDSGYDLTLLYAKKSFGATTLYGTGVVIEPPWGWYFDVVPRSSIIKRGYLLSNNVGIIDRSYRGEIFVPLVKIDPAAEELELPARVAQLIPRPIAHFPVRVTQTLGETQRGAGGFGSTGR